MWCELAGRMLPLVRSFVIAGGAAGFAVHQTVLANPNVERGLAEAAIFVALTLGFGHFTLCAAVFSLAGSGGHRRNVSARGLSGKRAVGNVAAFVKGLSRNELLIFNCCLLIGNN